MGIRARQLAAAGISTVTVLGLTVAAAPSRAEGAPSTPAWAGFANNAQHTAVAAAPPQPLTSVHWQVPVDLKPVTSAIGGPFVHYASPMITNANTVVVPTRLGPRRGFELVAYAGADGTKKWTLHTDYTVPLSAKHLDPPPVPAGLLDDTRAAVAAAGGTLLVRSDVDQTHGTVQRLAFYGLQRWRAHRAAFARAVQVTTPLTTGPDGSVYFGFSAAKGAPGHLRNGVARISPSGQGSWVPARTLSGAVHHAHVALSSAPALSPDGETGYIAVISDGHPTLVGFDTATLAAKYAHQLRDPQTHRRAELFESSSATPTVGPDGDVFYGVLGNPLRRHDDRGWLLHFGPQLRQVRSPGSFGWDQTVSVVPSSSVPSYAGESSYLVVSKYNNYVVGPHGDGRNKLALLDPHASQKDPFSRVRVMREVRTILSPLHPRHSPRGFRFEWCVNSVAVDPATGTAIANNEDGHLYRWDLNTGQLTEKVRLNKPQGEDYTETVIGPDGTSYAIEDATLYAVGG